LTLSMDLPFAQQRWCGAAGAKNVRTLSDHRDASFGTSYGLLIKELRLLARAVLVLDREGMVRYLQLVPEVGSEPDYAAALAALAKLR
jgi:thiol peroxidase